MSMSQETSARRQWGRHTAIAGGSVIFVMVLAGAVTTPGRSAAIAVWFVQARLELSLVA